MEKPASRGLFCAWVSPGGRDWCRVVRPTARRCRVSPRRASYLSLLRQSKVTERKASRIRRPCGHAALLGAAGVWLNSLRSNNASPDPSAPALLASSLRRGCGYLRTKELALLSPKSWDDKNDSFFVDQYAKNHNFQSTYVLCLAESPETYHHWKIFTSGSNGVCIEFKKDELITHALKVKGLRAEPVSYSTIKELRATKPKPEQLPFLKRQAFRDEAEFRLFVAHHEPFSVPIRFAVPTNVLNRIVLSPWIPKSVSDQVKATIKEMAGCKTLKVYRSTLVENEGWKQLGGHGA